jgi:hypothetical protein
MRPWAVTAFCFSQCYAMLYLRPYGESNTQIEQAGITRIWCIHIICLYWKLFMHANQTNASTRPYVHTHTHTHTHTRSLSLTHTHKGMHTWSPWPWSWRGGNTAYIATHGQNTAYAWQVITWSSPGDTSTRTHAINMSSKQKSSNTHTITSFRKSGLQFNSAS